MAREGNVQTKMVRLGRILRIFMERDEVATSLLSREFRTTPRTIQRDLLLLKESGFPLHEVRKGTHRMEKDLVKNLEVFDDTELALVVALKNIVGQLGDPFRKAADGVLDRLYDCTTSMPVFVKIDDPVPLDGSLLNKIIRAVREKRQVAFQYTSDRGSHPVQVEPYRVAYFGGFWYLIGSDTASGVIKRYALDRIGDLKLSKGGFRAVPADLDDILRRSANIWFTEDMNLEVTVSIDASVSHYFRRRRMFPTQEIKEERPDGSLLVTFRVGTYEAIRTVLKSWIPNIVILSPEELRASFTEDVKEWLKRQEEAAKGA